MNYITIGGTVTDFILVAAFFAWFFGLGLLVVYIAERWQR